MNAQFNSQSVFSLGIQVIKLLEIIHNSGYVFNNLSLENLYVDFNVSIKDLGQAGEDLFEMHKIFMNNMSFATPYIKG